MQGTEETVHAQREGEKKMLEYDISREELNRSGPDSRKSKEGTPKMRSMSAKRDTKSANQKL